MAFEKGQQPPQKGEKIKAPAVTGGADKVHLTSEESALFQRITGGDEDWKNVKESEVDDFSMANDPMALPGPAKEKFDNKEFAFSWKERSTKRMDEVRSMEIPRKWWPCNAVSTPFLEGWFDPITGGVNKLDCILYFKPYWMYEKEKEFKRQAANRIDGGGDLRAKAGMEKAGATLVYDGREIKGGSEIVAGDVDNEIQGEDHGSAFTAEDGASDTG